MGSNPIRYSIVDGYRNGYNGADLKSDVTKVLWVRILHHPPYEDVAQAAEHLTFNQRVVSSNLTIFTIYPIRLANKPRGYGPRIEGLNPSWGTIYGLLSQSVEEVGSNPIKFRFESEVTHQYAPCPRRF